MKTEKCNFSERLVTLEGMMTFCTTENGRHALDFMNCEDADMEAFEIRCKVQGMRDGNVYITELPKALHSRSTLLRKAAHGRLSATKDEAYQLTLKVFKREGLDVKETMLREAIELINNVKL